MHSRKAPGPLALRDTIQVGDGELSLCACFPHHPATLDDVK